MSQLSEERVPDSSSPRHIARVLPFERPQSEAQRAVRQQAQETLELEQVRKRFKPTPLRWLLIFAAAAIPVALTLGAVDGILRAMQMLNAMYEKEDAKRALQAPAEQFEAAPSEPGLVLLKPVEESEAPRPAETEQPE